MKSLSGTKHFFLFIIISVGAGLITSCSLFTKPLYEPGNVSSDFNNNLEFELPAQDEVDSNYWKMEDDILLYHFEDGIGEDVLVIHGGPGIPPYQPWVGLQEISDKYRFLYYHQRGCGNSTKPIDTFSSKNFYKNMILLNEKLGLGTQIADIERIRRILKKDKIIIIGHSFGGFLAALYAAEFPNHVKGLVLISPAGVLKLPSASEDLFKKTGDLLPEEYIPAYTDWLDRYLDFSNLFEKSESDLVKLNEEFGEFYLLAYQSDQSIDFPEMDVKPVNQGGWMGHAMYMSMGREHDYRSALNNIQCPTLIIHGEKDFLSVDVSNEYAQFIAYAKVITIPDAGHFAFNESPSTFSEIVESFLSDN